MHTKWVFKHFRPRAGKRNFLLVLLWGIGLVLGLLLCSLAPYNNSDIIFCAISTKPSAFGSFLICVLPVVFAAISVHASLFGLSCLAVFLNAVSRGFCGTAIFEAVGTAAWLLRPLLLFTTGCTSVLMWWILLQNNTKRRLQKRIFFALCLSCFVYIIELFFVSPLVGDLAKVL